MATRHYRYRPSLQVAVLSGDATLGSFTVARAALPMMWPSIGFRAYRVTMEGCRNLPMQLFIAGMAGMSLRLRVYAHGALVQFDAFISRLVPATPRVFHIDWDITGMPIMLHPSRRRSRYR